MTSTPLPGRPIDAGIGSPSPEFAKLYQSLQTRRPSSPLGLTEQREAMSALVASVPADTECIPSTFGNCPGVWIDVPESVADRIVVLIHGGGFVKGTADQYRSIASAFARATSARVVVLDYPLAPEAPFPSAITAIADAIVEIGAEHPSARIALAGDSAGANLCLAAMLLIRDRNQPLPVAAAGISIWADLHRCATHASAEARARDPIVTPENLVVMRDWYLNGADAADPRASPVLADLRGLPPLLLQVGGAEVLLQDSIDLARAATNAGVEVELEVFDHMTHVWHAFVGRVPEADVAVQRLGQFLERHLRS